MPTTYRRTVYVAFCCLFNNKFSCHKRHRATFVLFENFRRLISWRSLTTTVCEIVATAVVDRLMVQSLECCHVVDVRRSTLNSLRLSHSVDNNYGQKEKPRKTAEFAVWGKITKKYMYTHFWRPKPLWKLSSAYSELCGRVCRWWDFILICSAVLTLQVTTDGQTNRVAVALVYRAACSTSFGKNDDVCAWQKTEQ